MKEPPVDGERAVVAHDQAPEIAQPANGALDDPAPLVPPQCAVGLVVPLAGSLSMLAVYILSSRSAAGEWARASESGS